MDGLDGMMEKIIFAGPKAERYQHISGIIHVDVEVTDNGSHQVRYYSQTEKGRVSVTTKWGNLYQNLMAYISNYMF